MTALFISSLPVMQRFSMISVSSMSKNSAKAIILVPLLSSPAMSELLA